MATLESGRLSSLRDKQLAQAAKIEAEAKEAEEIKLNEETEEVKLNEEVEEIKVKKPKKAKKGRSK